VQKGAEWRSRVASRAGGVFRKRNYLEKV